MSAMGHRISQDNQGFRSTFSQFTKPRMRLAEGPAPQGAQRELLCYRLAARPRHSEALANALLSHVAHGLTAAAVSKFA